MKIEHAISSAILVVLLTAQMAWAQDNIRAAMEAANNEWSAAYNSLNGKAFPALYTKDAVLMPPGVQPINGSEAIGQFWTDLIKAGNRKNFAIEIASIQRDGKYAYQTGRWTLDLVKDNGEVTKVVGSTVRIFEEQPDAGQSPHLQCLLTGLHCGALAGAPHFFFDSHPAPLRAFLALKTAKALGLEVPWFPQQRADTEGPQGGAKRTFDQAALT